MNCTTVALGLLLPVTMLAATTVSADESEPTATRMPRVRLVTNHGDIVLQLNARAAPLTVANFVRYATEGFYNGTIFHRVIDGFMIQGGGFTEEGRKTEGLHPEIKNEWENGLKNKTGTIAMARRGRLPDSASSQFFINVADNDFLDQPNDGAGYAVFGHVVEGTDVVNTIAKVTTGPCRKIGVAKDAPKEAVVIEEVTVLDPFAGEEAFAALHDYENGLLEEEQQEDAARQAAVQEVVQQYEEKTGKTFAKTESGLLYLILEEGSGPVPSVTDTVEVHYTGTLLNGKEFDSSRERGRPASFPLNRVIKGWTEGLAMMQEGGHRILIIPPGLAYGDRAVGNGLIPANSTLVFDVELLSVK